MQQRERDRLERERERQIREQQERERQTSNSTFLTNLKQGLENLLDMEERFETDPKPGKYQSLFSNWVQNILYYSSSFEFNFWTTNVSSV